MISIRFFADLFGLAERILTINFRLCSRCCANQIAANRSGGVLAALALGARVGVEGSDSLGLSAGHQLPRSIEADRDRSVAQEGRRGLGTDAGSDHQ